MAFLPQTMRDFLSYVLAQKPTFYYMAVSSPDQGHLLPAYTVPSIMKPKCHLLLGIKINSLRSNNILSSERSKLLMCVQADKHLHSCLEISSHCS